MRTSIHIRALRFYAHHGVLPQEQKVGNYFKVETTLYTDFSRALVTDELTDTLNYAEVCKIISDEMAIPSRLLEHVAGRITNSLRSHYPQITGGRLIVTKEKPQSPATFAMCQSLSNGRPSSQTNGQRVFCRFSFDGGLLETGIQNTSTISRQSSPEINRPGITNTLASLC